VITLKLFVKLLVVAAAAAPPESGI
jgi:hypothetical protein